MRHLRSSPFASNLIHLSGATALGGAIVIAASPWVTRLYSPSELGSLGVFTTTLSLVMVVAALRYDLAIPYPKDDGEAASVLVVALVAILMTCAVCALLILTGLPAFVPTLRNTLPGRMIWWLPIGMFASASYLALSIWMVRRRDFSTIGQTKITQGILQAGSQITFGALRMGASGLIAGQIVGSSAGLLRLWRQIRRQDPRVFDSLSIQGLAATARAYRRFPLYSSPAVLLDSATGAMPLFFIATQFGATSAMELWAGRDTDPTLRLPLLNPEMRARVVLAHRRLSILDLSTAGHQPMCDDSGRFWVVLNGEIYNYLELRRELAHLGHQFKTGTDTEVLLAALSTWGHQAVRRFRGMFAFAVIDSMRREVLLARDPFGIKPLYYSRLAHGGLAFASEMKALTSLPDVSSDPDADMLYKFLRFGLSDHGDRTMFSDIRQLQAGHTMLVRMDEPFAATPVSFWSLPQRTNSARDAAEAGDIIRQALSKSISLHMRSDVPVGSCLSGGLDSTAIVAVASEMMPTSADFGTVSFISDDPATSEADYVAIAERTYRIHSHRVEISPSDIQRDLAALVRTQDVPFGSLSIYAQFAVFRTASTNGLTVMLDGQGSDELLGGYNTAVSAAIAERLAAGRLVAAASVARGFDPIGDGAYRRTILSALGRFIPPAIAPLLMRAVNEPLCPRWLDGNWFAERGVRMAVRPQGRGRDALDQELRLFTEDLSLPQLLRYEDRNSMAFGIESRVPFCDVDFAAAAASIPTNLLVTNSGHTKEPLRAAFRGVVPNEIIDRRKVGFSTPDREWISALKPWLATVLSEQSSRIPFLRTGGFLEDLEQAGTRKNALSQAFWRVLSTVLWADAFDVQAG